MDRTLTRAVPQTADAPSGRDHERAFPVAAGSTSTGHFAADGTEWLAVGWSVVLAVLPVVINLLNPADGRYGRGS